MDSSIPFLLKLSIGKACVMVCAQTKGKYLDLNVGAPVSWSNAVSYGPFRRNLSPAKTTLLYRKIMIPTHQSSRNISGWVKLVAMAPFILVCFSVTLTSLVDTLTPSY